MKTCKEKALEWNVSPRSVNDMCKKGRIQGAIKEKGSWLIPDDSPKPMDGRVSNGKYIKKNMVAKAEVKSLPISCRSERTGTEAIRYNHRADESC